VWLEWIFLSQVSARGNMTKTAGGKLAIAATIATRYSCVRKQGFANTKSDQFNAEERAIIDYQVQRYRVLKQLAIAYAMKFTGTWMVQSFSQIDTTMKGG
jgi:acyl-CoA oxidase